MKNYTFISVFIISSWFIISADSTAQKLGFTYQAVAIDQSKSEGFGRDSQGEVLANRDIDLRFTILEEDEYGPAVYQETHLTKTDVFGIFRLIVGRGNNILGNRLEDLNWGEISYFMQVEIDLGSGYEILGIEELLGSPYALNNNIQLLELNGNELSISKGNTINLNDNDATNELIESIILNGTNLEITDAGGNKSVDLSSLIGNDNSTTNEIQNISTDGTAGNISLSSGATLGLNVNDADASTTNELQTISKTGNTITLSNSGGSFTDDVNDADFNPTNEIQNISTDGTAGNISLSSGATLGLNVNDADASTTNELQTISKTGNTITLSNSGGSFTDDVNDADFSPTNEIQDISTDGTAGNISLSSGATLGLNVNDADASTTNELQTISKTGSTVTLSNSGGSFTDDVNDADFDPANELQNISTDGTAGNISLSSGATLGINVNDADASTSNELQTISKTGSTVTLSNSGGSFTDEVNDADFSPTNEIQNISTDGTAGNISLSSGATLGLNVNDADASTTNELQTISKTGSTVTLSNSGGSFTDAVNDADYSPTNEIQDLQLTSNNLKITNNGSPTTINLSTYLDANFSTTANVTSNAPGDYATDDFVFGSPQLDDNGIWANDRRMFFDKSKGAFRAGYMSIDEWDEVNRGFASFATGSENVASGDVSVSLGGNNVASGNFSFAMGVNSTASGWYSSVLGHNSFASGNASGTIGSQLLAKSLAEVVVGINNTDYVPNSTTSYNSSDRIFVIGNGTSLFARSDALIIYKNGDGTLAGTLTQLSDARLKKEVAPLAESLSKLSQLQGVNYKWNTVKPHDMESLQTGLIAQEVEKIFPELVKEASDGYKSVNYVGLIPHLIEAVKELEAKNTLFEQESNEKIKSLEERLLRLEKLIESK